MINFDNGREKCVASFKQKKMKKGKLKKKMNLAKSRLGDKTFRINDRRAEAKISDCASSGKKVAGRDDRNDFRKSSEIRKEKELKKEKVFLTVETKMEFNNNGKVEKLGFSSHSTSSRQSNINMEISLFSLFMEFKWDRDLEIASHSY